MAAVLDHSDTRLVARVHSKREFGNRSYAVAGTIMGTPSGAAVVDNIRLRNFWCCPDFADSVHDAQAFLEVCLRIGSRNRIQQQHRGLTACLQHALAGRANQQAMRAG
jgi:5-carboxymethyl-2-hydroxymuconate isomerase